MSVETRKSLFLMSAPDHTTTRTPPQIRNVQSASKQLPVRALHNEPQTWKRYILNHPLQTGLCLRLIITTILPYLLDSNPYTSGVKYTDIDYLVFSDAARLVSNGKSPYDRHTYRYTPFLAQIMSYGVNISELFGRVLFCVADALCGYIVMAEYEKQNTSNDAISCRWKAMLWWLLNPLPINICTRGSAEALVVLLPVLASVRLALACGERRENSYWRAAAMAGFLLGISVHCKLYPVIYSLSFMAHFSRVQGGPLWQKRNMKQRFPWLDIPALFRLVVLWIKRFSMSTPLVFLLSLLATFSLLTYASVYYYGEIALEEGILYHFSRVDHRHNYSMFWYWIYLARARASDVVVSVQDVATSENGLGQYGLLLLIPQVILLGFSSVGLAPADLSFALFVQTFLFVTHNKVITAQYFTWYLCLLPLCADRIRWKSRQMFASLSLLGVAFVVWLLTAFCLEMKGMSVHLSLWLASLFFFVANTNLFVCLVKHYVGFSA